MKNKISNQINKERARKEAQLEELNILTEDSISMEGKYINFFVNNIVAGNAPDAQLEEQQSNKLHPDRYPSSILGWGAHPVSFKEFTMEVFF
ncbi:MAG: hypothetical protein AABW80_01660 [Nanoarchaeota archaeon]